MWCPQKTSQIVKTNRRWQHSNCNSEMKIPICIKIVFVWHAIFNFLAFVFISGFDCVVFDSNTLLSSLLFVVFLDIETHMMQSLKKDFFVAAVLLFIFKSQSFLLLCHCDHQHCCWRSSSFEKETGCFFHTATKNCTCVCVCEKVWWSGCWIGTKSVQI